CSTSNPISPRPIQCPTPLWAGTRISNADRAGDGQGSAGAFRFVGRRSETVKLIAKAIAPGMRRSRLRLEQIEIDRHPHRQITRVVRMQLVARTTGRALRHEFRLQAA